MEESAMDELYGDFGQRRCDSLLNHDEDSVDIYSGLDDSPKRDGGNGQDCTFLSPSRLRESMDLYEEIITEEQEEKEATYNELKSKFDAAQNQVQELLAQLQQIQSKNTSLHKENMLLKKNICALIKTARMEIVRKDQEISKLSNIPVRNRFHPSRMERSQELCLRTQANACHSVKSSTGSTKVSQDCVGVKGSSEASKNKDGDRLSSLPAPKIATDASPSSVPLRCSRRSDSVHCQSKDPDGTRRDHSSRMSDGKAKENSCSEGEVMKSLTVTAVVCNRTDGKQLEKKEGGKERFAQQSDNQSMGCNPQKKDMWEKTLCGMNKSERSRKESAKVNCVSNKSQGEATEEPILLRRSGRSKSPFSPRHLSPSELHSQTSKGPSRVTLDTQTSDRKQESRHQGGEERRSRSGAHSLSEMNSSEKSGISLDWKMEKRRSREHHRKEERRQEDAGASERRRTRSDGSKEHEQKKARENEGRSRQEGNSCNRGDRRSTRSEGIKEDEQQNPKESDRSLTKVATNKVEKHVRDRRDESHSDGRKNRPNASPVNLADYDRGRTRGKRYEEELDKRKSSKTDESFNRKKTSSNCNGSRDGKSLHYVSQSSSSMHSVKEKCANGDKGRTRADEEKQISAPHAKSTNAVPAADATKSTSPKKSRNGNDGHAGETASENVNVHSPLKLSNGCDVSAMTEESSPKRKLSFMETLNLTLSPIKKQRTPAKAEEPISKAPEDALEDNSAELRCSFEQGEEFCVIDEIENSQESVDAMENIVAPETGDAVQALLSNSNEQPSQREDINPKEKKPDQDMEVKEKELEYSKSCDTATCEDVVSTSVESCMESKTQEEASVLRAEESGNSAASISEKCAHNFHASGNEPLIAEVHLPIERSVSGPSDEDACKEQKASVMECEEDRSRENSSNDCQKGSEAAPPPTIQNDSSQEVVSTSVKGHPVTEVCSNTDTSASLEVVSSTVSVEMNPQNEADCAEPQTSMPDVEITVVLEKVGSCLKPSEEVPASSVNTSVPSREKETLPEQASSSEPDSTENVAQSPKPSSSVVPQDEDSMMLTLNNIKLIPEAISPLTSPVRQNKIAQHCLGKQPHLKCVSKDLSTAVTDKDTVKMDMNKENKRPDLSVKPIVMKAQQEVFSSAASGEELEEGEIDSKSDEESSLIIQSPQNEKAQAISTNQPNPRSPRLEKRASQMAPTITPTRERDRNLTSASKDSPTFNKRRFKTIAIPPKTNISTPAEFMNMMLFIRSELRRKYMKLHKNVTKSAFCCIVDMSLASFTDFIDGVNFQRFSSQGNEIKPKLNKILSSVMSKVSNNGIVNRIFEQRADDLKQKLWNFVDGQFDFMFKELKATLKGAPGVTSSKSFESKVSDYKLNDSVDISKLQAKKPLSAAEQKPNKIDKGKVPESKQKTTPPQSMPCRVRGLGSRGKNIKATMEEGAQSSGIQSSSTYASEKSFQEVVPVPENKTAVFDRRLSHSGSTQDRTDFEILTEQQTSSLTFNLVTDSQMGDIFRCLLQGSDLLETGITAGENQSWSLNTPQKEGTTGEAVIGVLTPNKIMTPSKHLATWTSFSPYKLSSPNNKIQLPLNPSVFDESCLLEVPSNVLPTHDLTTVSSQQSFSILAEDLAVSLTIPSPLKSDGHLSFLHPANGQPLSAPSSVISAHFSEDALLDGEDATEQDIHLSLDTDNSSCESSTGQTWGEGTQPPVFHFKPNLPMQAEVMERSNDHFIVRIRHTSHTAHDESGQETKEATVETNAVRPEKTCADTSLDNCSPLTSQPVITSNFSTGAQTSSKDITIEGVFIEDIPTRLPQATGDPAEKAADASCDSSATDVTAPSKNEELVPETNGTCERMSRKRRKHHSGPKAKRSRTEKHQDRHEKQRHKKRSKSCKEKHERTPSKKGNKPLQESPSLSAKNVIRKKGEVVVTWTRDEDRDILIELKMKGPSSKTFVALSAKLKKSPTQIEERVTQLMKLLKKKEKLES